MVRNWTISTYKCSRQSLYERLGKTNRTVDAELDGQIQVSCDWLRAAVLTSDWSSTCATRGRSTTPS